jgi:hypothetical protein
MLRKMNKSYLRNMEYTVNNLTVIINSKNILILNFYKYLKSIMFIKREISFQKL